jgi:hypothetical protein
VKTELVSGEETLPKHDEKVQLAARIASEQLSWSAGAVGRLLVLPDLSTPRRRIERHAAVFGPAYPIRGLAVRRWLRQPVGSMAGLIFMDSGEGGWRAKHGTHRSKVHLWARPSGGHRGNVKVARDNQAECYGTGTSPWLDRSARGRSRWGRLGETARTLRS